MGQKHFGPNVNNLDMNQLTVYFVGRLCCLSSLCLL